MSFSHKFIIYMDKPLMPNLVGFISMGEESRGVRERHEVWEHVNSRTMIHKTFSNDSTIYNIRDFNFIGGEINLIRRPSVGHLVDWQEISSKTIQNIIEGTMVKINATFTLAFIFLFISQKNIRTLRIIKRQEVFFCLNHVPRSSKIDDKGRRSYNACSHDMNSLLVF